MPAHLKSFMRNSDVYKKKNIAFLTFEKRADTKYLKDVLLHIKRNLKSTTSIKTYVQQ
jgi:hypothetical protein